MKCNNCGSIIDESKKFCPNCGKKLKKNKSLIFLTGIIFLVVISLGILFIFQNKEVKNRTIMIYAYGDQYKYSSSDRKYSLKNIVSENTDYQNNNILIYVDGKNNWFDFAKESGIYRITENGAEYLKNYTKLEELLDYSYKKYKANNYDLILWNYGITSSKIDIFELKNSLENSKFNSKNKFEYINYLDNAGASLEYGLVLKDYSKYYIASEYALFKNSEITDLTALTSSNLEDSAIAINKKYIEKYNSKLDSEMNKNNQAYAIIDLDYINKLEEKINAFFESVDLERDYKKVAQAVTKVFHYYFNNYEDNVDLYNLIYNLKNISIDDASELINALSDAVVYCSSKGYSNSSKSNGLSIYFPFYTDDYLTKRNTIVKDYYSEFVEKFMQKKSSGSYDYSEFHKTIKSSSLEVSKKDPFYSFKSPEMLEFLIYAKAKMYRKANDGYTLVYETEEFHPSSLDTYITVVELAIEQLKINDQLEDIYINSKDGLGGYSNIYVTLYYDETNKVEAYLTFNSIYSEQAKYFIVREDTGYLLNLSDFKYIEFNKEMYKLYNEDGTLNKEPKLIKTEPLKYKTEDFKLEKIKADVSQDYKPIVYIYDIYGKFLTNSSLNYEK